VDDRFQVLAAVDFPAQGRTTGNWYPAVPPLCRSRAGIGPADYFGRTLVSKLPAHIRVGVVNVSVAGCKIELFDKNDYPSYVAKAPSWMMNPINDYGRDSAEVSPEDAFGTSHPYHFGGPVSCEPSSRLP